MAYNKVEIMKILNWQVKHKSSNQEVINKFKVARNTLISWQNRFQDCIIKETTALVKLSTTNTELIKNNYEVKNIERADAILEACFERLTTLLPQENDIAKISTVMKTMLLYKDEVKPGSVDSAKSRIEKMIEESERRMLNYSDAEIVP